MADKPKRRTSTKPSNKTGNRSNNRSNRKREETKSFFSSNIGLIIGGIVLLIISLIFLRLMFTLILVIGISIILGCSHLIKKLKKKKGRKIVVNTVLILFLLLCIAGVTAIGGFMLYVVGQAPKFDISKLDRAEKTLIYDIDNKLVAELGTEKRENINYEEISEVFIDALVAVEDSRFFQHNGFDAARFAKASLGQVAGNSAAGGASTLSMQVIKNSFTSTEAKGFKGIVRKFTDIYLAMFKLEKNYTKQEIIEFYVNNHYLGAGAYGVEQASQTYFGKAAKDLNLAEAATIAGMFQSPNTYNPFNSPEKAEARRNTVLKLMYKHGYISKEESDLAKSIPIESLIISPSASEQKYQSYIDVVVNEIKERYDKANPYNTPMIIYTNMISSKQQGLDDIYSGKTFDWADEVVQSGVAAVDAATGKIVAIGGGRNRDGALTLNYATGINKQIGSTAKPLFDYAPGIEYNNWSTYEQFNDEPYNYSSGQPLRNSDRQFWGWMSLRTALAQSRNVPALKAFQAVDNKKIIEFVSKMGLKPEISNGRIHEAHSIGAFDGSNPLQVAAAYATLANGGTYHEPYAVNKVIFRNTGEEFTYKPEGVKVMSDSTAFMVTDCLVSSVQSGLASGAKINGVNVAAKTGTTNYTPEIAKKHGIPTNAVNDAWVIGYDPDIVIGLWYGYDKIDKNNYLDSIQAVVQRSRVFKAAGNVIFSKNGKDFKVPNSVVKVGIEAGSNPAALPSASTPESEIIYEYFKVGTEPTESSDKYSKLDNVANLKVVYNPTTLSTNITWSKAAPSSKQKDEYGPFGYKLYKDGVYLGFSSNNYFSIPDDANPYGKYRIITSYEKYNGMDSSGAEYTLKDDTVYSYKVELQVPSTKSYTIGSTLELWDTTPSSSDIKVTENESEMTDMTVRILIKNVVGETIGNINTTASETYTITYSVIKNSKTVATKSRTVTITP